jgi:hypothetical protein
MKEVKAGCTGVRVGGGAPSVAAGDRRRTLVDVRGLVAMQRAIDHAAIEIGQHVPAKRLAFACSLIA